MAGSVVKPLSLDATCTGISATLEPNFFIQFETPSRIEIVTPSNLGDSHARLVRLCHDTLLEGLAPTTARSSGSCCHECPAQLNLDGHHDREGGVV